MTLLLMGIFVPLLNWPIVRFMDWLEFRVEA
jgi:hypothetical protein